MADLGPILADLTDESTELDELVGGLTPDRWRTPTPAAGWTVAHQIGHLHWTDRVALLATTSPAGFQTEIERATADIAGYVDRVADEAAAAPPEELLGRWREGRAELARALTEAPAGTRIPWFGPPMSTASMASARLMETWAHGQDVYDALGVEHRPAARLWHVARLGVRTRDFAFLLHSLAPPTAEFRVELTAPDGSAWAWGPAESPDRLTGSALDFCLVVTQRRHRDDSDLVAHTPAVAEWLGIAQAFAGPPGVGRQPAAAS